MKLSIGLPCVSGLLLASCASTFDVQTPAAFLVLDKQDLAIRFDRPADEWTEVRTVLQLPEWATRIRVAHVLSEPGWLETLSS